MKKTISEFQNQLQKGSNEDLGFKKMKYSELLLQSQCEKIVGGTSSNIIIVDLDIL